MRPLLILSLLFLTGFTSRADYNPIPLYRMILTADKIAYGEIISLDSTSFQFRIEGETIEDREVITVWRFEDWPCAARWTNYAVGQKMLLFLVKHNGAYVSMGAGNEGALPVLEGSVYINSLSLYRLPPRMPGSTGPDDRDRRGVLPTRQYSVYGGNFYGYKVGLNQFLETIETLKKCVDFNMGEYRRLTEVKFKCSNEEVQLLCEENPLLESMVIQMKRRYLEKD